MKLFAIFIYPMQCKYLICFVCISIWGEDAFSGPAKNIMKHKVIEPTIFWWPFWQVRKLRHKPHLGNHQDHSYCAVGLRSESSSAASNPSCPFNPPLLEVTESRLISQWCTSSKHKTGFPCVLDQYACLFTTLQDFYCNFATFALMLTKVSSYIPLFVCK